jgi:hypothetical protein
MRTPKSAILVGIISLFSASWAMAQSKTFEDWFVTKAKNGDTVAGVFVEDGSQQRFLGARCFVESKKCVHLLVTGTRCDDNMKIPMLMNAKTGSALINATCHVNGSRYELLLSPYDSVRSGLTSGDMVGFALPLESGQFRVIRFSLKGAVDALNYGEEWIPPSKSSKGDSTTL